MPVYLGDKKVSIFAGAGAAKLQEKTVTPTERQQTVTPDTGYDGMSQVTVDAVPAGYIGSGVTKKATATYTPKSTDQVIAAGQYLSGAQTIKGDANLVGGGDRCHPEILHRQLCTKFFNRQQWRFVFADWGLMHGKCNIGSCRI